MSIRSRIFIGLSLLALALFLSGRASWWEQSPFCSKKDCFFSCSFPHFASFFLLAFTEGVSCLPPTRHRRLSERKKSPLLSLIVIFFHTFPLSFVRPRRRLVNAPPPPTSGNEPGPTSPPPFLYFSPDLRPMKARLMEGVCSPPPQTSFGPPFRIRRELAG